MAADPLATGAYATVRDAAGGTLALRVVRATRTRVVLSLYGRDRVWSRVTGRCVGEPVVALRLDRAHRVAAARCCFCGLRLAPRQLAFAPLEAPRPAALCLVCADGAAWELLRRFERASKRALAATPPAAVAEIVGPSGRVHYRRPPTDPLVAEARATPGYSVRLVAAGEVST